MRRNDDFDVHEKLKMEIGNRYQEAILRKCQAIFRSGKNLFFFFLVQQIAVATQNCKQTMAKMDNLKVVKHKKPVSSTERTLREREMKAEKKNREK